MLLLRTLNNVPSVSACFKRLACVSQKTRKLLGPENFSGLFSGAFFGFRKAFLKAPEFLPKFSGMFSGNVTQGIARSSGNQIIANFVKNFTSTNR